ncbi:MAG: adenylate/guanylate cyclase domain-containing protein [Phycisphaeraceae bacterium]|nr:adenylate/guanylate cyclase domain-containing protein [Phycisphaeraceae bacterium]
MTYLKGMRELRLRLHFGHAIGGLLLVGLAALADWQGWLSPLEQRWQDLRVQARNPLARHLRLNQSEQGIPRVVLLEADAQALEAIGAWPWSGRMWARLLTELGKHEPRVVGICPPVLYGLEEGNLPALDKAIGELKAVVVGLPMVPRRGWSQLEEAMVQALLVDPGASPRQLVERLASSRSAQPLLALAVEESYESAWREAMARAIRRSLADQEDSRGTSGGGSFEELRNNLLPRLEMLGSGSVRAGDLRRIYDQVVNERQARRLGVAVESVGPWLPALADDDLLAGLPDWLGKVKRGAFVGYWPDRDGVVRAIPLWVQWQGQRYPHMSLAMICAMLDLQPGTLRFDGERLLLPLPGNMLREIPLRLAGNARGSAGGAVPVGVVDIPWEVLMNPAWNGPDQAEPAGKDVARISLALLWRAAGLAESLDACAQVAERTMREARDLTGADEHTEEGRPAPAPPQATLMQRVEAALADAKWWLQSNSRRIASPERRQRLENIAQNLVLVLDELRRSQAQFDQLQTFLDQSLRDSGVMLAATDPRTGAGTVATSLGSGGFMSGVQGLGSSSSAPARGSGSAGGRSGAIPGAVPGVGALPRVLDLSGAGVAGAVVDFSLVQGILRDSLYCQAPGWVSPAVTGGVGLLLALLLLLAPAAWVGLAALGMGLVWMLINDWVLCDAFMVMVNVAGLLLACFGVTLWGLILAALEPMAPVAAGEDVPRRYMDPVLAGRLAEHPESFTAEGKQCAVTAMFVGISSYLSLAEQMGAGALNLLKEFRGAMVPVIRSQHGWVGRFTADGLVCFFGGMDRLEEHAADALGAALEMQEVGQSLISRLKRAGLPPLRLAVGISSGQALVGDAGTADMPDVTAVGEVVRLAAQLQSATSLWGVNVLAGQQTIGLAGTKILTRPLGLLRLTGKRGEVMAFEPMALAHQASGKLRRKADLSRQMVQAFGAGDAARLRESLEQYRQAIGEDPLLRLYQKLSAGGKLGGPVN